MTSGNNHLPIRVVQPSNDYLHQKESGGGPKKLFMEESAIGAHTIHLTNEIKQIRTELVENFKNFPGLPNVVKISLNEDAIAKSNRPKKILDKDTCPVIGTSKIGELLLSATEEGLKKLENRIETTQNKIEIANITAIQDFKMISSKEKTMGLEAEQIFSKSVRNGKSYLKVILFDHQDEELNKTCVSRFTQWCESENLDVENITLLKKVKIYKVSGTDVKRVSSIINHPSVRKVSFFPSYRVITPLSVLKSDSVISFPKPLDGKEYPLVGVIDSGTSENHPILSPWIAHRENFVPKAYQDNYHGSFVSGLVSMGNHLNGGGVCPEEDLLKIVDLQIVPKSKESPEEVGDTLTEDDLILRLQETIPRLSSPWMAL